jgi:cell wall-associated NlpC family hydrolase
MFFWDGNKGKIGHVAIYIGGGMMIDASSSNGKVVKRSAVSNWCKKEFKWARRPW